MRAALIAPVLIVLALAAAPLDAADISYSYVSGAYSNVTVDVEDDANETVINSLDVAASYALTDNIFIAGSYSHGEMDTFEPTGFLYIEDAEGEDLDLNVSATIGTARVGAGLNYDVRSNVSLFAQANYVTQTVEATIHAFGVSISVDDTIDGIEAVVGVRALVAERLEGFATLARQSIDGETTHGAACGVVSRFSEVFGAGLSLSRVEDSIGVHLSATWYFD